MERILYHYTDYAALSGIVKNAELRVNNVLNMNDLSEMTFFLQRVSEEILAMLGPSPNEKVMERLRGAAEDYMERRYQYSAYASCFSLYEDDAAQWERYGNRGRGVCIGFNEEVLQKILLPGMYLESVYYDSDNKSHELASEFLQFIRENEAELAGDEVSDKLVEKYVELMKKTVLCSAAYKHPSFICENEVRLLFWPVLSGSDDMQPEYHITGDRIKKYYPLDLRKLCGRAGEKFEDLFVSVKVGPESNQSPEILADYFCSLGMESVAEKVVRSSCPLVSALHG